MADVYLRSSDGNDGDDGSTWALAKATIAGAMTTAGAGGRIWMSSNHSESGISVTGGGTVNAPIQILSVDDTGSTPPVTADLLAGGTLGGVTMTVSGYYYMHGVYLTAGNPMFFTTNDSRITIEGGKISLTGSNDEVVIGSSGESIVLHLINTDVDLTDTSNTIQLSSGPTFLWEGGTFITNVTTMFNNLGTGSQAVLRGVDCSAQSGNLVDTSGTNGFIDIQFHDCKMHASRTVLEGGSRGAPGMNIQIFQSDISNNVHGYTSEQYEGTVTDETSIYRTSGASDGTTAYSLKMAANTNVIELIQPLVSPPIVHWTDSTGVTNFDVEILIDSATTLYQEDVYIQALYHSSTAPGGIATSKPGILEAVDTTELTTSTEAWTGDTVEQTYTLRATTGSDLVAGPVTIIVYVSKNVTIYVDPVITES